VQLVSFLRRLRLSPFLNSLIVMGGYILSRITGLVRDVILAAQFGTSPDFAAYRAAFKVPDLLYIVIIGGALGSTFIPVFIEVWDRDGSERAWRMASAVLTWVLGLLALASGLLWVLAPLLAGWFFGGQGFTPAGRELISDLTRLFLLSPLLLGLGGLAMAALNARDRFTLPAMAPSVYNLGIIAGTLALAPQAGIWGTAWGVIAGALGYLLVQIPGLLRLGMRLRLTVGRGIVELRTIARQMVPRVVGQSAAQLSILVTAALTARLALGDEKLAGLDYAYQLMLLPYGIFALSLSTVAFPLLARLFADRQLDELADRVRQTLRMILFLTLPATVMLMVLAVPLVRLVLQRGAFDQASLTFTVMPLLAYATALPAFAASEILIRTFYAMQQTLIPVLVGLLQVGLNLGLGTLALSMGGNVGTLALAFSVANNIEMLLLIILLQWRLPGIWRDGALRRSVLAAGMATVVLGGMLWTVRQMSLTALPSLALEGLYFWRSDLLPLGVWLATVGIAGLALYVGLAGLLGSGEARMALSRLRRLVTRA
jgi:putative peptidoglycan lipid II flippase